jgi:hypothetical protein
VNPLILVVDDEHDVKTCFASTSGVTCVLADSIWSLSNLGRQDFNEQGHCFSDEPQGSK